ncbi:DUF2637 domain-containing protein [Streptomyces sp. 205]|uniref:DUF2637 domain-containing protein n=1 Tax=Streptomyces coffeae TaxID=621382 RepID=A0ABS1N9E3_9ACTN|nr:DUF2637 domain-containing protein [Streptomyces coffeae]
MHDIAEAAGQTGWKAWAYPVSVDLLLVAAWRGMRTVRRDGNAWLWFLVAMAASLSANIMTSGVMDLTEPPNSLRVIVAGWPAVAFLGGTLLVHSRPTSGEECEAPAEMPQAAASEPPAPPVEEERRSARKSLTGPFWCHTRTLLRRWASRRGPSAGGRSTGTSEGIRGRHRPRSAWTWPSARLIKAVDSSAREEN